jgi:hypothetical protein
MLLMQAQENGTVLDEEGLLFLAGNNGNTFDADVDDQPVQDMALNDPNIFQVEECDAFDADVDDEPTAQTIFMANLSAAASSPQHPDSSITSAISEVPTSLNPNLNNPTSLQGVCDSVQLKNIVNTNVTDMGNTNNIPYEMYVNDNGRFVIPSDMPSIDSSEHEVHEHTIYNPDDSLLTRINTLKDQVNIYEQRAKFELNEREQKMEWQIRTYISENNYKQETLKRELVSLKNQLDHAVKQKQEFKKGLTSIKLEYKDKETKLLNDFSKLKMLKNKLEDNLYTQGQTIQSAQMMQNHRKLSDEFSEQDASKPKSRCLRIGLGAQPALYDANTILEPNHAPPDMRSYDEIDEAEDRSRAKLAERLKDPKCIAKNIVFHYDYANDNHYAIFVPQKRILPDKVFWNIDIEKMQAERVVGNTRTIFRIADPTIYPLNTPRHLVPFTLPT